MVGIADVRLPDGSTQLDVRQINIKVGCQIARRMLFALVDTNATVGSTFVRVQT